MRELPEEENPDIHYNRDKENFILVIFTNFQCFGTEKYVLTELIEPMNMAYN